MTLKFKILQVLYRFNYFTKDGPGKRHSLTVKSIYSPLKITHYIKLHITLLIIWCEENLSSIIYSSACIPAKDPMVKSELKSSHFILEDSFIGQNLEIISIRNIILLHFKRFFSSWKKFKMSKHIPVPLKNSKNLWKKCELSTLTDQQWTFR